MITQRPTKSRQGDRQEEEKHLSGVLKRQIVVT